MAKNVVIRDVTYNSVPSVTIPLAAGGGEAVFTDTSGSTLTSGSQMLSGVTSYDASGTPITGTIASKSSSDLTANGATVTVPAGNYAEQATKTIESGTATAPQALEITNASWSSTATQSYLVVTKSSVSITPRITKAGYISEGTSGNCSVTVNTNISAKASATYTPTTSNQTISAGVFLKGAQTIKGDANLVASNIVAGKSIFGVAGSAQIPVISQDSTTKVLSIS